MKQKMSKKGIISTFKSVPGVNVSDITGLTSSRILESVVLGGLTMESTSILNNHLSNISLTTEYMITLLEKVDSQGIREEMRKLLLDIIEQVKNCAQITKKLVLYSNSIKMERKKFSLNLLLNQIIISKDLSTMIKEKDIKIIMEIEECIEITGDKMLLFSIFHNLISDVILKFKDLKNNPQIKILLKKKGDFAEIRMIYCSLRPQESDNMNDFEYDFQTNNIYDLKHLKRLSSQIILKQHGGRIIFDYINEKERALKIYIPINYPI
ncbi:MAG: hypothetical protein ACTSR3_20775 [Candidatus Helarchaeota archaeon]